MRFYLRVAFRIANNLSNFDQIKVVISDNDAAYHEYDRLFQ